MNDVSEPQLLFMKFRKNRKWSLLLSMIACSVVFYMYLSVLFYGLKSRELFDDAYMFVRYANNWIDGKGWAWNFDGEQTFGFTSILYQWIVILGKLLIPVKNKVLLQLLSWGTGLFALIVFVIIGVTQASTSVLKNVGFFTALFIPFAFKPYNSEMHVLSGMDTNVSVLCHGLLILSTLVFLKSQTYLRMGLMILTAYLSFLARPDNGIYAFCFPVLCMWLRLQEKKIKHVTLFSLIFFSIIAFDTLMKYQLFGDPLPLSYYAKKTGFYEAYLGRFNAVEYLKDYFRGLLFYVLVIFYTYQKKNLQLFTMFAAPVLLSILYFFTVIQIMGFGARFYYPSFPFIFTLSVLLLDDFLQTFRFQYPAMVAHLGRRTVLLLLLIIPLYYTEKALEQFYGKLVYDKSYAAGLEIEKELEKTDIPHVPGYYSLLEMGDFVQKCPPGVVIAASEYGYLSATACKAKIIDFVGLHDNYIARNGCSVPYLMKQHPDIIWFPHRDYTKLIKEITFDDEFRKNYLYVPGGFSWGLAFRKDSPHYEAIMKAFLPVWKKNYPGLKMQDYLSKHYQSEHIALLQDTQRNLKDFGSGFAYLEE